MHSTPAIMREDSNRVARMLQAREAAAQPAIESGLRVVMNRCRAIELPLLAD